MGHSDNPMGSIFDGAADEPVGSDRMPHDPLHGPLYSGFPWEREQGAAGVAPHEGPRTEAAGALPPTADYLLCLVGPCRNYHEWLEEHDSIGEHLLTKVQRLCSGTGKPRTLNEGTCFACTQYAPPFWSVQGWRRRVISAHRIAVARRRLGGRAERSLVERAVDVVYAWVRGDAPELPQELPRRN